MSKVSVIIPTYNYENFICDAVDSVLEQNYNDYEIIIIDDGSTDGTYEKLEKYNNRIQYFFQKNKGPAAARNFGINQSSGEYICFLDADDIFLPNKLKIQINILESQLEKDVGLVYSDFLCIDEYNIDILKYYKSKDFSSQFEAINYLMKFNYINTSTVMIRKKCLEDIGLFNEEYEYLEDLDLWIRIGKAYRFIYVNKPLVKTRSHPNSLRNKVSRLNKVKCYNNIIKSHLQS